MTNEELAAQYKKAGEKLEAAVDAEVNRISQLHDPTSDLAYDRATRVLRFSAALDAVAERREYFEMMAERDKRKDELPKMATARDIRDKRKPHTMGVGSSGELIDALSERREGREEKLNERRASAGLPPVKLDGQPKDQRVCTEHNRSVTLRRPGDFYHDDDGSMCPKE